MKGPGERLKYDLRRVWECPVCRLRERTGGDLASLLCHCQEQVEPTKRQWMKLVEDGPRRNPETKSVFVNPVVAPAVATEALAPEPEPANSEPPPEPTAEG